MGMNAYEIAEPLLGHPTQSIEAILSLFKNGVTIEGDAELTEQVAGILRGALHSRETTPDADIFKELQ